MGTDVPPFWSTAKAHLWSAAPRLRPWLDDFAVMQIRSEDTPFRALCSSIIGQQISISAARAVKRRLSDASAGLMAQNILEMGSIGLRQVGLSARKAEYIVDLAKSASELDRQPWAKMTDGEVRKKLIGFRGIGPWTADMFLIFQLGRPDILPLGDGGIVRAMQRLFGPEKALSSSQLEKIAEPWRPYRSVASWYLWQTLNGPPKLR